jgi:hypothetical protein
VFRFTIRDVLWLMVVVAVALTLWLGWSRETAKLKKENAAREAKLHQAMKGMWKDYSALMVKTKKQQDAQKASPDEN